MRLFRSIPAIFAAAALAAVLPLNAAAAQTLTFNDVAEGMSFASFTYGGFDWLLLSGSAVTRVSSLGTTGLHLTQGTTIRASVSGGGTFSFVDVRGINDQNEAGGLGALFVDSWPGFGFGIAAHTSRSVQSISSLASYVDTYFRDMTAIDFTTGDPAGATMDDVVFRDVIATGVVPEPASVVLVATGALVLGAALRRRRKTTDDFEL